MVGAPETSLLQPLFTGTWLEFHWMLSPTKRHGKNIWLGVCEDHLFQMKKGWSSLERTPNKEHSCTHPPHP